MDQEIKNSYSKLSGLNVSRETFLDFESYISMIFEKNEKINLMSNKFNEKNDIIERHIIDSAQIIDIVEFNYNTTTDIGSGGGMPGKTASFRRSDLNLTASRRSLLQWKPVIGAADAFQVFKRLLNAANT